MPLSKNLIPLTDEKMGYIIENYGKISVPEIARKIGETKDRVYWNYRVYKNKKNKIDQEFFNSSEEKNWII